MAYVLRVSEPLEFDENEKPKLDPSDPRVRKLVYSMYRDMLTNRNNEANHFISQKDPSCVKQDLGVVPILETIVRQGSSGTTPGTPPAPPPLPSTNGTTGIPPPPVPPMAPPGSLPAMRLNSEIGPMSKGPPKQIQGAMMKDKKPFTYTPGGIDLFSEIRSPRMAKRIQMNAAAEGVTSVPTAPHGQGPPNLNPSQLPPAAIAAMQPQLPVAVFPQGGVSQANLQHRTHPMRPNEPQQINPAFHTSIGSVPPPPPPPQSFNVPLEHELRQGSAANQRPTSPRPPAPPMSLASVMNQSIRAVPYAPPSAQSETQVQSHLQTEHHHLVASPPQQEPAKTKAQAASQQIGPIYIPPPPSSAQASLGASTGDSKGQLPHMNTNVSSRSPAVAATSPVSDSDRDTGTENINSKTSSPLTPQLNKAPTPWLTSPQNKPSPQPGTPWGTQISTRTIPINLKKEAASSEETGIQLTQNGRTVPLQASSKPSGLTDDDLYRQSAQSPATGARIIPIQFEGFSSQSERNQQSYPHQKPTPKQQQISYGNPKGQFTGQQGHTSPTMGNRSETTTPSLHEGMDKVSLEENYRTIPVQSRSFKVLQRITDDEDQKREQHKLELKGEDKQLMDSVKSKVDESSLHQTTEPRFRGTHIPSRAFQALRNNLPPSPDTKSEFQVNPGRPGPVTHTIQIQMAPPSPTQGFQNMYYPGSGEMGGQGHAQHQQQIPQQRFTGGNIPSRSFRMLQAMNPDYDYPGAALERSSTPAGITNSHSSPSPSPVSHCTSPTYQGQSEVNSDQEQSDSSHAESCYDGYTDWDSYWYYYWYWGNYWHSLGYDTPPPMGWEGQGQSHAPTPTRELQANVSIPSKKFKKLQQVFDAENEPYDCQSEAESPAISDSKFDKEISAKTKSANLNENDLPPRKSSSIRLGSITEDDDDQEDAASTASKLTYGIVEEPPDFPSDDPGVTSAQMQGYFVEECPSDSESEQRHCLARLSTIDEVSETERGISSRSSYDTVEQTEESDYMSAKSDDEDTFDDESSVSVIENADADLTTTAIEDSSSTTLSSSSDEDAECETFTIRLPLRRSFTKSRSYRDIATVLVGPHEVRPPSLPEEDEEESNASSADKTESDDEQSFEAPNANVEFTNPEPNVESEKSTEGDGVDFWSEIIGPTGSDDVPPCPSEVKGQDELSNINQNEEEDLYFWDTPQTTEKNSKLKILEQFQLSQEFSQEVDEAMAAEKVGSEGPDGKSEESENEISIEKAFPQNERGEEEDLDLDVETDWNVETKNIFTGNGFRLSEDSSALLSASDETSDESSSKSSTATVTLKFNKTSKLSPILEPKPNRPDPVRETALQNGNGSASSCLKHSEEVEDQIEDSCNCQSRRAGKTENLLWRIERFLQQSFTSLGSEEDSGVMTDQSRQMSDAETDNDDGSVQSQTSRPTNTRTPPTAETLTLEQQRRALSYERAKTHSRLFQLLQEECDREDEEEAAAAAGLRMSQNDNSAPVTPSQSKTFLKPAKPNLLPGSDSGLSVDSSGSLSGSSGLLSPMNREQSLLVDIIQQLQSRQKRGSTENCSECRNSKNSVFPSKIFKMLHDEFGEEFYDVFDLTDGDFDQGQMSASETTSPECPAHKTEHCQPKQKLTKEIDTAKVISDTLEEKVRKKGNKKCKGKSIVQQA